MSEEWAAGRESPAHGGMPPLRPGSVKRAAVPDVLVPSADNSTAGLRYVAMYLHPIRRRNGAGYAHDSGPPCRSLAILIFTSETAWSPSVLPGGLSDRSMGSVAGLACWCRVTVGCDGADGCSVCASALHTWSELTVYGWARREAVCHRRTRGCVFLEPPGPAQMCCRSAANSIMYVGPTRPSDTNLWD